MNEFVLVAIIIVCVIYVAIDYTRLWMKVRRNEDQVFEFSPYEPVRHIFIMKKDSKHMENLVQLSFNAHKNNGADIMTSIFIEDKGYAKVFFDNGDELVVIRYGESPIEAYTEKMITEYTTRVFFDEELPDSAIKDCVKKLGLKRYMFSFGFVGKEKL